MFLRHMYNDMLHDSRMIKPIFVCIQAYGYVPCGKLILPKQASKQASTNRSLGTGTSSPGPVTAQAIHPESREWCKQALTNKTINN